MLFHVTGSVQVHSGSFRKNFDGSAARQAAEILRNRRTWLPLRCGRHVASSAMRFEFCSQEVQRLKGNQLHEIKKEAMASS